MKKESSVILNTRVPSEIADKVAVIGLGNKTKGVITAVLAYEGLAAPIHTPEPPPPPAPPPIPLGELERLGRRVGSDVKYLESLLAQVAQGLQGSSERLLASVIETEQTLAGAVKRNPNLPAQNETRTAIEDDEEPLEFVLRAKATLEQVERKFNAWEADNVGHAKSVKNPFQSYLQIWQGVMNESVMHLADCHPRQRTDGLPMTVEERRELTRKWFLSEITDEGGEPRQEAQPQAQAPTRSRKDITDDEIDYEKWKAMDGWSILERYKVRLAEYQKAANETVSGFSQELDHLENFATGGRTLEPGDLERIYYKLKASYDKGADIVGQIASHEELPANLSMSEKEREKFIGDLIRR